jgi:glutaminase
VDPRTRAPRAIARDLGPGLRRFGDADSAMEWCETQVLRSHGFKDALAAELVPLGAQDLLSDLTDDVVAEIELRAPTRVYTSGTIVFDEGDEPDGLYFIGAGLVSAEVRVRGQRAPKRLSTMAAGSAFGELALVDGNPRSTRIVALEPTICYVLSPDSYAELQRNAPEACAKLTLAIARGLSQRLRYSTVEVAALEES